MKVLMLDIDGPIATSSCWGKSVNNKWGSYMFDPKCVAVLNFILQETGAEIIISSDWRLQYTLQEMREIFCHNNIIKGPIGFTPTVNRHIYDQLERGRADEILLWVKENAWKNDIKWVAIDDLNMGEALYPNFVLCPKQNEGIKQTGIKEKIIKILNE